MKKKDSYRERLKAVREKVLSPTTLYQIKKKKRLYYERILDDSDALIKGSDIIAPFDSANPYQEYKKWLGVLGGLYAGSGLAKSVVKDYMVQEYDEIEKYIKSIDIDTSSAMGEKYGDIDLAIFDHYCYPYDTIDNIIISVNLDLVLIENEPKDLESFYEKEWHPTKNGHLFPHHPNIFTNKKYWWLCPNNHEWSSSLSQRVQKGLNCPLCNINPIIEYFDDYLIIDSIIEKIAKDFYVSKNQISLKVNQSRDRGSKFEFLAQKRLTLLKKQFESLGKLSNKKNYKYSNENWLPLKDEIFNEVTMLIQKFENVKEAKSFIDVIKMYNDEEFGDLINMFRRLKNKVNKSEALEKEPRKDS
jgi:hypothetical protein